METPPIQASPQFKARTEAALGGAPSNPTQFQAVTKPEVSGTPAADSPQRRSHSTFDVNPKAEALRTKINTSRAKLGSVIHTLDEVVHSVGALLDELKSTTLGKEEAERQGFDLDVATKFLVDLSKAADSVKPKSK